MNVFEVFATLGFNADEFNAGLSQAEQRLGGIERTFSNAGRSLTTHVSAPLIAVGVGALKAGGDFQAAMNQVAAVSSATGDELEALREQARELGATTQFSASEAADAMNFLAMAGMKTDDILGAMPDTLQLAAAAQLDMGSAADIVTNIMAGYGMEIDELTHATDVLVQAFTNANTDLPQLAEAMKYAGPVASAAGVNFEDAAAAIALMGNAGIQGSMAGTSLRGAITRMLNPTSKVAGIMEAAGLSFTDAEGRLKPLDEIITDLTPHADDAGMFMEIFGQRAGPAMAALVSQGSEALTDLTSALHDSGGRAKEVADVQMEGLTGAMRLFKSAGEALLISIAESGLLDAATSFLKLLAGWIQNLSELNPWVLKIATVLGGLLASLGPVIWAIGSFAGAAKNLLPLLRLVPGMLTAIRTAFTLLTGPVGIIIGVITALIYVFTTDFLGIRTATLKVWDAVKDAFTAAGAWIRDTFNSIGDTLTRAWDTITSVFSRGVDHVQRVFQGMRETISNVIRMVTSLFRGDFRGAWNAARDVITSWWDTINTFFGGLPQKFLNFGKDLITGLIDGVKSMVTNAVDAVKGVGSSIISGFKNLLGIESPSKVFHGFGMDITEGLARGVEAGTPRAVAAVETLGRALKGAGDAIVKGAFDPDDLARSVTAGLEGRDAIRAAQERLEELRARQVDLRARPGRLDRIAGPMVSAEIEALQREIQRLNQTLRDTTTEQARSTEQQTTRFARAVTTFDSGVRGLQLANQRY